jgi:hypothetical protein
MNSSNADNSAAPYRFIVMLFVAATMWITAATPAEAAIVNRDVLKSFFVKGAKPTSAQFSTLIDSTLNI